MTVTIQYELQFVTLSDREGIYVMDGSHADEELAALWGPIPEAIADINEPAEAIYISQAIPIKDVPSWYDANPRRWANKKQKIAEAEYNAKRDEELTARSKASRLKEAEQAKQASIDKAKAQLRNGQVAYKEAEDAEKAARAAKQRAASSMQAAITRLKNLGVRL